MRRFFPTKTLNNCHSSSQETHQEYEDIIVVDQPMQISLNNLAPSDQAIVSFKTRGEIEVYSSTNQLITSLNPVPVREIPEITLLARTFSDRILDRCLQITFQDDACCQLSQVLIKLTCVRICLDVDADRDGVIEEDHPHKGDWQWGINGHGAVLLVNNDRGLNYSDEQQKQEDQSIQRLLALKDLSFMSVRRVGLKKLPAECQLCLSVDQDIAKRIRIYDQLEQRGDQLIGSGKATAQLKDTDRDIILAIEGLSYPDFDFDGMVEITLSLVKQGEILYSDRVIFRVAPWIMTPNTLAPITVFVSRLSNGKNEQFIDELRKVVGKANAQIDPVPFEFHQDDPWMRDEIEIGYTQAPGHFIHVILDSPRDRGLDHFAQRQLIGTDFGYVVRKSRYCATKLDSFGNLEVSPPVTVNGINYPFGRLIFGGTRPEIIHQPRRMLKVVRDFLYAQKIQAPLEIFSDWLSVGHIDEFMTFVPASTSKGFKLLLASTDKSYELLKQLRDQGQAQILLRQGKQLNDQPADISVADVLNNQELTSQNQRFQEYINWNREVLKQELGLDEEDIIDIPALFQDDGDGRAETFFPNMVNLIVLNQHLAIPKPFGPKIKDQCQFEAYVKRVLEPLGKECHFIDDWEPYFRGGGEIHCGTNTRRQPFTQKWWEIEPNFL
ncbi:Protein-arginine deiminase [Stanieria cyanosphaera PCC 7437]|uniref:Protein-arginine deiminase n=1 Tax=Stanieria cyanosphaera (strain ATCC 29371 / PCC 7437) TaxID=111780 RepID=K9XSL5_STAC7|nr:protein-arginine deiminase family protein [Stanieria cyanosphaera]AFZ34672.1 Protein-arginine deiminase [Stanieria cyanosphaera PCC 7437]